MWANNGDLVSRQYAGTAALKGDFTRTGERKVTGLMKDGYYSANRYLQTQFKDAYRQVTIGELRNTSFFKVLTLNSTKCYKKLVARRR